VLAVPLLESLPLLWRRFRPWPVMVAVAAAHLLSELNDPEYHVRGLSLGFACYAVARYARAPRSLVSVGVLVAVLFAPVSGIELDVVTVAVVTVAAVCVWLVGASLRRIHADAARLRELTERLRVERERNARQAVATERSRIAYELHDLVAHHVSAIAMMARAAADDPAPARADVAGISATAETALAETRHLMRLLADGHQGPAPSLAHLNAGDHVEITTVGLDAAIPQAVRVSAYRIVQEALANAAKHAGAVPTQVHVRHDRGMVTVTVVNDPPPPEHVSPGGTGLGLIGLRERAALFGGTHGRRPHRRRRLAGHRDVEVPDMIRILVVDDHELVRAALRRTLGQHADLDVAGEAADGSQAVREAVASRPDVVLMDVRMPGMTGVEACRRIVADVPGTRVLMLTTFDHDEHVHDALRAGAAGFVLKNAPTARLVDAVRVVAAGGSVLAPTVTRRLIDTVTALPPAMLGAPAPDTLTPREREVLALVATGLSNRRIAKHLGLSESSVKSTVNRILTRLGLENRVQAALLAHQYLV